jgi:hypothetical protein
MILSTQAAAEYAVIALQQARIFVGRGVAELRTFAYEHTLILLLIVLGLVALYALRPGPGGR